MPFLKLNFKPGINKDQTNYSNEGGWFECNKIRFYSGFPQKIGGWLEYPTVNRLRGICRQMFGWITTFNDNFLALGTNAKVYIDSGGFLYDITPIDRILNTPDTDNCISTTISNTVTFTVVDHGGSTGDYVIIAGVVGSGSPENIGGIPITEINKEHIITVLTADTFTIQTTTAATSITTDQGGTTISLICLIPSGNPITIYGYGWGTGGWGSAAWGINTNTPVNFQQRDWWFDQFDNDLVMNIRNGAIYYWERGAFPTPTTALDTRAIPLSDLSGAADVPDEAMQILVSQNDKHLLAFGCTPFGGGDFVPLLIRWASQDDPGMWTPIITNSAGFIRISRGSSIIRALPTRQEIVVFTNSHLYSLQFTGTNDVFALQELADNISIIASRAVTAVNNVTYGMGQDKFYAYSGRVETLPCTLRNHVFMNFNYEQADQVVCGSNEGYNEVWWFYPTADSIVNNAYVIYNYLERVWYYGTLNRTAWLDSPLRQYPQAANGPYVDGSTAEIISTIYNHEQGVNDNTLPMNSYIQSSDFDITEGDEFMLTKRILPDINFGGSTDSNAEVLFTIRPRNFPGSSFSGDASDTQNVIETSVSTFTDQVFVRTRARQLALKVESEALNVQWQLGSPRLDARKDGQR